MKAFKIIFAVLFFVAMAAVIAGATHQIAIAIISAIMFLTFKADETWES